MNRPYTTPPGAPLRLTLCQAAPPMPGAFLRGIVTFAIELDREDDGRWLAKVPALFGRDVLRGNPGRRHCPRPSVGAPGNRGTVGARGAKHARLVYSRPSAESGGR